MAITNLILLRSLIVLLHLVNLGLSIADNSLLQISVFVAYIFIYIYSVLGKQLSHKYLRAFLMFILFAVIIIMGILSIPDPRYCGSGSECNIRYVYLIFSWVTAGFMLIEIIWTLVVLRKQPHPFGPGSSVYGYKNASEAKVVPVGAEHANMQQLPTQQFIYQTPSYPQHLIPSYQQVNHSHLQQVSVDTGYQQRIDVVPYSYQQ